MESGLTAGFWGTSSWLAAFIYETTFDSWGYHFIVVMLVSRESGCDWGLPWRTIKCPLAQTFAICRISPMIQSSVLHQKMSQIKGQEGHSTCRLVWFTPVPFVKLSSWQGYDFTVNSLYRATKNFQDPLLLKRYSCSADEP